MILTTSTPEPFASEITSLSLKSSPDVGFKPTEDDEKKVTEEPRKEGGDPSKDGEKDDQEKEDDVNSTNNVNTVSSTVNAARTNEDVEN
ncbi:hypothetical protein Tco_0391225 [Tanacetum coccineum]